MINKANQILNIENLSISFGGINALKDISINIPKDKITCIIGPNGAGKTTFFNCITGFYKATSGNIILNKDKEIYINHLLGEKFNLNDFINLKKFSKKFYYKLFGGSHLANQNGIARTFQNIRLFSEVTVMENLLIAQHNYLITNIVSGFFNTKSYKQSLQEAIEKAHDWLKFFNIDKHANHLAKDLSYGIQKKVEIARAMCTRPILLCLDEPAAGLNNKETKELSDYLIKIKESEKISILLIEHDMDMVMNISDYIYVLDNGSLLTHGKPDVIKNDKQVISAYLGVDPK